MGPYRFRLTPIVTAALIGGVLGFVLYYVLNSARDTKGQKLLPGIRWPFDQPGFYIVVFGGATALATIRSGQKTRERENQLARLAERLGVAFEAGEIDVPATERPRLPHCMGWSQCANRFSGRVNEIETTMFDLTTSRGDGESTSVERSTVVLFHSLDFPAFRCIPKLASTKGLRDITAGLTFAPEPGDVAGLRAVSAFTKHYLISLIKLSENEPPPSNEAEVREFFVAPRLESLSQSPNWYIESGDGALLLAIKSTVSAAERERLWYAAIHLCRELGQSFEDQFVPIPPVPGMDLTHAQEQLNVEYGQKVFWGVAGVFFSFCLFSMIVTRAFFRGRNLDWMVAAFPFVLSGGYFIGAQFGKVLNRRWRSRSKSPGKIDVPPLFSFAPDSEIAVIIIWTICGWFVGCLASFLVAESVFHFMLGPNFDALRARLFVGIPIGFLMLGLLIGYLHGRSRMTRKQRGKPSPVDLDY